MPSQRNLQPTTYNLQLNPGFTLMEIMIVVSVIAILASTLLFTNIRSSLQKARDSKRKQDLSKMTKVFDDYYNDKQSYPASDPSQGTIFNAPWGAEFPNYVPLLPKDPISPSQVYYYQTGLAKHNYYALFTKLENTGDPDIEKIGCTTGCGPGRRYNYVVLSSNIMLMDGWPTFNSSTPRDGTDIGDDGFPIGYSGGTPPPTSIPSPTIFVPPTGMPGAECRFDECCVAKWCGGGPGNGTFCVSNEKCWYDPVFSWMCYYDTGCN